MKRIKVIVLLTTVIALMLTFAGCGSESTSDIQGSWKASIIYNNGETTEVPSSMSSQWTLDVSSDSWCLNAMGDAYTGTWEMIDSVSYEFTFDSNGNVAEVQYDSASDELTFYQGSNYQIYERY